MNALPGLFRNKPAFEESYVQGLDRMLTLEGLGTFILVLANASYDESIYLALSQRLGQRYHELVSAQDHYAENTPDDIHVFEQIRQVELDQLVYTSKRALGPWSIQYNLLRSFRPSRLSKQRVDSLFMPFDPAGFHFNKSFLEQEIWWEGNLLGRHSRLLYNKFPFSDYHGLLVIEPACHRPQVLTRDIHEYIWQLAAELSGCLPGIGLGYNAYGAAASVNHQHFQIYCREGGGYPIENPRWIHHGGGYAYPLNCFKATTCKSAWDRLESLHAANTAYNLLYRPGLVYIIPRRFQGSFADADWMTGMGWSDMAGEFTVIDYDKFQQLSSEQLESRLRAAAPTANPGS